MSTPSFKGFPQGSVRLTSIPGPFFSELLPAIDHLGELKLSVYVFWRLDLQEDAFRYLRRSQILEDERFMQGLGPTPEAAQACLDESLQRCVRRGTLLLASVELEEGVVDFYFLNSPKGRAAVEAITRGQWRPSGDPQAPLDLSLDRPNIFRLYEEHIGPLTPLIAEMLGEAEDSYPASWIEDAFRIAVENNARSWKYIRAILDRWQEGGRDARKDRRDVEKDRRRYVEGEYSDFIEH